MPALILCLWLEFPLLPHSSACMLDCWPPGLVGGARGVANYLHHGCQRWRTVWASTACCQLEWR